MACAHGRRSYAMATGITTRAREVPTGMKAELHDRVNDRV
jgi:hypothetical protein